MKRKSGALTAVFLAGMGLSSVYAQHAITAAHCEATGSGGTLNYSVGLVTYKPATGSGGSESPGVQQPLEFFTVGVDDSKDISLSAIAYPNPAGSTVNLKVDNRNLGNLSFVLYDLNGTQLLHQKINSIETSIPMEKLASGSYFLKVSNNDTALKTFKIIKNN